MKIRRNVAAFLVVALGMIWSIHPHAFASGEPPRIINVVYDDSGSMIATDNANLNTVDTWCQAKYAMEVFAAMLGENDTMNIYYMSDFSDGSLSGPKLILNGKEGAQTNVSKIHNTVSEAKNTPFDTVRKAMSDLSSASAEEKWLVVLTDGEFQGIDNVDSFFAQKNHDIKVMYLGMGPEAGEITDDEANGIYCEKAETNNQILGKITGISTRIFNSDRLDVNVSAKTIDFDVPMSELTIFAQGANVSIEGILDESGKTYLSSTEPVNVQYSEKATVSPGYPSFRVAENLKGRIATFKDDFGSGKYTLQASGADTIEVYYKPNVQIAAYLIDDTGSEVTSMKDLENGEYTIQFGLVKAGTDERVKESTLLGTVSYEAVVTNNGKVHEQTYSSGDRIYVEEGTLEIDAVANYLKYNSVSTHLSYSIFENKNVEFTVLNNPSYQLTNEGVDFSQPIEVKLEVQGDLTPEQWDELPLPTAKGTDSKDASVLAQFRVEKGSNVGLYEIYPSLTEVPSPDILVSDFDYILSIDGQIGAASWVGESVQTVKLEDKRTRVTELQILDIPDYSVTRDGFSEQSPILIQAITDGEELTQEFWDQMVPLEAVVVENYGETPYGNMTVTKSSTPGLYEVYPSLDPGLMSYKIYEGFRFEAEYPGGNGTAASPAKVTGEVNVTDQRSWLERNIQLVIRLLILACILILILGYIPPFKKYLPRKLKGRPTINCSPNRPGVHAMTANGKYNKKVASTLIPYRAERGTIKFVPPGVASAPTMQVKAAGGNGMLIMNAKAYAGKDHITFNGAPIPEGHTKPVRIGAGTMISVSTKELTYDCIPNQ